MAQVYGGLLVTAKGVYRTVAATRGRDDPNSFHDILLALKPVAEPEVIYQAFGDRLARDVLRQMTIDMMREVPEIAAIGVSACGPLRRVDLGSRADDHPDYGVINRLALHQALAGLDIYRTVQRAAEYALDRRFTKVRVHSDVVGGAYAEQHRRLHAPDTPSRRRLRQGDTLVFVHASDGIGGASIKDDTPHVGAMHQEFGYMAVQIDPHDLWAETIQIEAEAAGTMVVLEDVASEQALKERARAQGIPCEGRRWVEDIPPKHWEFESGYLAQLCGTLTMMHAPHQIVLDSPFLSEGLLAEVRVKFQRYLFRPRQKHETVGLFLGYEEVADTDRFIQLPIRPAPLLFGAICLAVREDLALP